MEDCCHTALVAVVTFEDHMRGIVSCVPGNWYFEVGEVNICLHLCATSLVLCIYSPV